MYISIFVILVKRDVGENPFAEDGPEAERDLLGQEG